RRADGVGEVAAERDVAHRGITSAHRPRDIPAGNGVLDVTRRRLRIEAVDRGDIVRRADDVGIQLAENLVCMELALDRNDRNELGGRRQVIRRIAVTVLVNERIRVRLVEYRSWIVTDALSAMLHAHRDAQVSSRKLENRPVDVGGGNELLVRSTTVSCGENVVDGRLVRTADAERVQGLAGRA